jgi:hypothetical protein
LFMPMSPLYRRELCQRHYKCALRFYFEEFLEEKLEEFEEFWEDNSEEFAMFWRQMAKPKRQLLLQTRKDVLLRKIRDRLFSEKHVDCNLALDVLYNAAEEVAEVEGMEVPGAIAKAKEGPGKLYGVGADGGGGGWADARRSSPVGGGVFCPRPPHLPRHPPRSTPLFILA